MMGGGEFIINGAERVVVSQLHRSPGVDFVLEQDTTTDRKLPSCRVIPERGSWIEVNVTKKDALTVRIDQSGKFAATTLLRAMDPESVDRCRFAQGVLSDRDPEDQRWSQRASKIEGKIAVDDVVYPSESDRAGEIIVEAGHQITKDVAETICTAGVKSIDAMEAPKIPLIFNTLGRRQHRQPRRGVAANLPASPSGQPASAWKRRGRCSPRSSTTRIAIVLGKVGRFRLNRKLGLDVSESQMTLASGRHDRRDPLPDRPVRSRQQCRDR